MFQKNLRVEKKLEFLEFCKRLGARVRPPSYQKGWKKKTWFWNYCAQTVKVASGEQTKKEQMFMNRGMAEEEKIEMCLSHPVGLPRGLDPSETTWWENQRRAPPFI